MQRYIPTPSQVCAKIEQIKEPNVKVFCKALYVLCATASELAGVPCKKENVYGPNPDDYSSSKFRPKGISRLKSELIFKHELTPEKAFAPVDIAVFTINMMRITKRTKLSNLVSQRFVALPHEKEFEPWTNEIIKYYKQAQTNRVFNFNRKHALDYISSHNNFDEFGYRVEHPLSKKQEELNKYKLDGLRYTRRQELKNDFGFSDYELSIYEGTMHINLPKPYELYLPKLLIRNPNR
jgi:hypothetical protein